VSEQTTWVSVDERLPEDGGYWLVTVATDDGPEVHSLLFASKKQQWIHEGEATFCHGYYFCPTHWAPLPAPASESAAGDQKPNEPNPDVSAYIASLVAERDDLLAALVNAQLAINSMKDAAETGAVIGDEQGMSEALEQVSNDGLAADTAIRKALSAKEPT
jgi:hypothetical protein